METTSNAELLQSFKDFFDRKSAILLEPTKCEWCGSTLEYFDAQFGSTKTRRNGRYRYASAHRVTFSPGSSHYGRNLLALAYSR